MKKMKRLLALVLALALALSVAVTTSFAADKELVESPVAGTAYKYGMIQENLSATDVYYLNGSTANIYYLGTTTDASAALDVYLEETDGGYYMFTVIEDAKKYINMVVSGSHVNGKYQDTASTVYTFDAEKNALVSMVNGTEYWMGTRNDKTYTSVGPVMTSYNGFYCQLYLIPVEISLTIADSMTSVSGEAYGSKWYQWTAEADSQFGIYPFAEGCTVTVHDSMSEDGTVIDDYTTFKVKSGDVKYICVSGTGEYSVYLYNEALPGTLDNPVMLNLPTTYTVPAGETLYFAVNPDSIAYTVEVTGENFSGIVNGDTTPSVDGVWSLEVPVPVGMMGRPSPVIFGIQNTGSADFEYSFNAIYPEGAAANPQKVELGEVTVTDGLGNHFLSYTATTDGVLSVTVQDQTALSEVILRSPSDISEPWYNYDAVDGVISVNVSAGDTVEIELQGPFDVMTWSSAPVTGTVTLTYVCTECNYVEVEGSAVAPTCTEAGKEADIKCSGCGTVVVGAEIAATGHTETVDAAVAPTCTETGLTEGSHCSVCNETLVAQETVAALGHSYAEVEGSAVAPTCTEAGKEADTKCSVCDDVVEGAEIAATGHSYAEVEGTAVAPTCTEAGKKADTKCSVCDDVVEGAEIAATGHSYTVEVTEATCTEDGAKKYTCSVCGDTYSETIAATGHDYEDGKCTVCGAEDPDYEASPETGDTAPVMAVIALGMAAAAAFIVLTKKSRA